MLLSTDIELYLGISDAGAFLAHSSLTVEFLATAAVQIFAPNTARDTILGLTSRFLVTPGRV
jgi:hypothetical protein